MNKNILILTPDKNARGGITNFYIILKKYFPSNFIYLYRGARNFPFKKSHLKEFVRIVSDYLNFTYYLIFKKIAIVQTTTSLYNKSVIRDGIFILIAKLFRKKVIVYYRGWNIDYSNKLSNNWLFKYLYFKADASILLTRLAKKSLIDWGYKKKIYISSTAVNEELIKNINDDFLRKKYNNSNNEIGLLFLARIEKEKGIYELINTYELLKNKYKHIKLTIAGDGREEENIKKLVSEKNIEDVSFLGFVDGGLKISVYKNNHIYLFPSYSEGMPTSVLEAMACGLPVITTAVGGLVDFFKSNINGFMLEAPPKHEDFAKYIEILISNEKLMLEISLNNHKYALENFLASKIAESNINICEEVINSNLNHL